MLYSHLHHLHFPISPSSFLAPPLPSTILLPSLHFPPYLPSSSCQPQTKHASLLENISNVPILLLRLQRLLSIILTPLRMTFQPNPLQDFRRALREFARAATHEDLRAIPE